MQIITTKAGFLANMKAFTHEELVVIAEELRTKLEEYANFHDVDDEYYEKVQEVYQKVMFKINHA